MVRVGLVLGAGGVLGGAWLVGGLRALERRTGWSPRNAGLLVGTSSGALVGALIAAGVPSSDLLSAGGSRIMAEVVEAEGVPGFSVDLVETLIRYTSGWAAPAPGSWSLARAELRRPRPRNLLKVLSGILPEGTASTDGIRTVVERWAPDSWQATPRFQVVACDYATGKRTVFGPDWRPNVSLATAVAASCALPSYYQPVTIAGRQYVDGAVHSSSNLDLLRGLPLDIVVALNPLSSRATPRRDPVGRIAAARRRQLSRRLGGEAAMLRATGTSVILLEPVAKDLTARALCGSAAEEVDALAALAEQTVAEQLDQPRVRAVLGGDLLAQAAAR